MLVAGMTGCVIFKSVTSSQTGTIGNVKITTTACASDTETDHSGYNPPDSACQGAGKAGNSGVPSNNLTQVTPCSPRSPRA